MRMQRVWHRAQLLSLWRRAPPRCTLPAPLTRPPPQDKQTHLSRLVRLLDVQRLSGGFKQEHPAALISTSQRAFASQWNQTWQRGVSPHLTPRAPGGQGSRVLTPSRRRGPVSLEKTDRWKKLAVSAGCWKSHWERKFCLSTSEERAPPPHPPRVSHLHETGPFLSPQA